MKKSTILKKSIAAFAFLALVAGSFGVPASRAFAQTAQYAVYFEAFVDGAMATGETAHDADFGLVGYINGVPSEQDYTLSASGYLDDPTPYQSYHSHLDAGSDFGVSATVDGTVVGETCTAGAQFSFAGYTSGSTMGEAAAGTPSMTALELTEVDSDNTVILWYNDCENEEEEDDTVNVHIHKFVDGIHATAVTAGSADFMIDSSYVVEGETTQEGFGLNENIASGSDHAYHMVVELPIGADYTINEVLDGEITGANCDADADFSLTGYTSGNTLVEAGAGTASLTAIALTNLTVDKHIVVWNHDCNEDDDGNDTEGEIEGDVEGGITPGALAVTSIEVADSTATADGTFASGWEYVFNITVPESETNLSMKFANWAMTGGSGTIAAANNIRISSPQADNSGGTILITAADTYSTPALHMTGDLNSTMAGKQVQVTVEVAIPTSSFNGSYTTQYGIQTQP